MPESSRAEDDEIPVDNWGLPPGFNLHPQPYGTAEVSESGVDISQLRNNLRLTPEERIRQMVRFVRFVGRYRGALRPPIA